MPSAEHSQSSLAAQGHIFRYSGRGNPCTCTRADIFFSGALSLQLPVSPQWSDSLINYRPALLAPVCPSPLLEVSGAQKSEWDTKTSLRATSIVVPKCFPVERTGWSFCAPLPRSSWVDPRPPTSPPPPSAARSRRWGAFVMSGENPRLSDSDRSGFLLTVESRP